MINTEEMARAARVAAEASDSMRRSANLMEETVHRMEQLLADGYGGNALRLIELLENAQIPEPAKPVAADETKDHYIGGRFVRYVRAPAGFSVECVSEYTVAVVADQKPGGVILADCPDCGSQVVVDSAAAPQEQAPADKDAP